MTNPWKAPEELKQSGLESADLQTVFVHDFNSDLAQLVLKHMRLAEKSGLSRGEATTGLLLPMCVGLGMMSATGPDDPEKLVTYLSEIILENLLSTREKLKCLGSKKSS